MVSIQATLLVFTSLLFLEGVHAAGNEEKVLIETVGVTSQSTTDKIHYQCTFRGLWTKERQPKNYPEATAVWSGPILYTHTLQFAPWSNGFAVTRGAEKVAEAGFTDMLIQEMEQQGEAVLDHQEYAQAKWFVNERDFVHIPPIEASFTYPYMSMMAGMQPSPDWFTGFYNYWLIDEYSRTWYDHLKFQLNPWDAGSDAGETYDALESDLDPPLTVKRFVPNDAPKGGELRGPDGQSIPVVGEIECFLVVGDILIDMPECDWFANPCCNETDKVNCNATLPNGAIKNITQEYQEVLANSKNAPSSGPVKTISFALAASLCVMQWILA